MTSPADQGIEAARRDARTVSPAPETVTFSSAVVIDTDTNDTEIEILRDGDCVGSILLSGGCDPRYAASAYEVVFLIEYEIKDRCFYVGDEAGDYAYRRTALAAAKRYARETLNREVG